jgi:DNA invertase Pin-like site-specific DNA recombinase
MAWSDRVSAEVASRRAGGRRRYHALRRDLATVRRHRVGQLLRAHGRERGAQARIARELNVSEATISRDIAWLLDQARSV